MTVTARGYGLFTAAVLLLAAGFRFAYPELVLLGVAAAGAFGYALVTAVRRPRLTVLRHADPDRVGRGDPATMYLSIRNGGRFRPVSLLAEDRCGSRRVPVPVLRLGPGRDTEVSYPVPTTRRGVVPVGPLRLTRRDPLGLATVTRRYGDSVEVWVHPRVHPLHAVPTGAGRSLDGRVDKVPHGSITFDSLREYVVGDELRRVHWRTSARVGELMVREHVDTSLPRIVVLLDNRASAHPMGVDGVAPSFESACEAAASVLVAALRDDLPVTLLVVAGRDAGGSPLDRLAAVGLHGTDSHAAGPHATNPHAADSHATNPPGTGRRAGVVDDPLRTATTRLRSERLGDTLVALTGPGVRDGLGWIGSLRGAYPSVLVAVFGADVPTPAGAAGMVVLDAADGAAFAAEWDGLRPW